jgi:hypothetical protein
LASAAAQPRFEILVREQNRRTVVHFGNEFIGSVIIIAQDLSVSPLATSCHSSHMPAIVSAGEPSRAVK